MRIIAGSAKGTRLAVVPSGTRPLSDRAREGLFSSLQATVEGSRVLDLFAGTGAMGIEALSRGARSCLFIDSAPAAARTIEENLRRARLAHKGTVRRQDARKAVESLREQFDLVLLDPPYRLAADALGEMLTAVDQSGLASAAAIVVLTRKRGSDMPVIPLKWQVVRWLGYGDAVLAVISTGS